MLIITSNAKFNENFLQMKSKYGIYLVHLSCLYWRVAYHRKDGEGYTPGSIKNKFDFCMGMILIANNSNNDHKKTFKLGEEEEENFFSKCNLNGIAFTTLIPGKKTDYEYSIVEILFPEDAAENEIPLHIQKKEIVIVYVIKGNFKIKYGQRDFEGTTGTVLKLERDLTRSFKRIGNQEGKLLVTYIPAGFENFFKDIASMNIEKFKDAGIEDPVIIQLLEKNYDTRVLFDEP